MEQLLIKNKESGKLRTCWVDEFDLDDEKKYFEDLLCTRPLDISLYEMDDRLKSSEEPFDMFGIECGKGWFNLLSPIFDYIEEYNSKRTFDEWMRPLQVKEKMGMLRIYMNFQNVHLMQMIREAENEASNVCEICGSVDKVGYNKDWGNVMCHKCALNISSNKIGHMDWVYDGIVHCIFQGTDLTEKKGGSNDEDTKKI